ncbi:MAG: hypothetical protein J6T43_09835 [Prevotella sp.]|jgi:hypothetical protein|nr:hypothetical protein [Prevotella sp.]MBR6885283.1 hypothetical protein [Prevotella sp.]
MKALNLNRLNLHAPYSVWLVSKDNYGFRSSHDVVFRICFVDDSTIWHEGAVEFSILNENMKASPNDKKVRETIFSIIEEFFLCNSGILLYQCETGDNRQSLRDRLFLRWFNEYKYHQRYFIKVSSIIAEGQVNYVAIIVQKDNEHLDAIIRDFDHFIGFFTDKPSSNSKTD